MKKKKKTPQIFEGCGAPYSKLEPKLKNRKGESTIFTNHV